MKESEPIFCMEQQQLSSANEKKKELLHSVSIRGPLGYEPNTLPLRHGADIEEWPQNIYEAAFVGPLSPPHSLLTSSLTPHSDTMQS